MASITIMFTDGKYGVVNYTFKMEDKDLQRLYTSAAIAKGSDAEALERTNGVVGPDIVKSVTSQLTENFIQTVVNTIQNTEYSNIVDKAKEAIQPVNIIHQGD